MQIALIDLDLLLSLVQNCKKCTFLGNVRTITQKGKMETRQMTSFLYLLFLLQLFVALIYEFENTQNLFSCGPHFGSFRLVKYLNFFAKGY